MSIIALHDENRNDLDLHATLEALPERSTVNNGVAWYDHLGRGRWTPDSDATTPPTISTAELLAEAKGEITIDQPETKLALPKVSAPELARFNALAGDTVAPWIFPKGATDPFHTTCPAWCEVERHEVEEGYGSDLHMSRPIPVLLSQGHMWSYPSGKVGVSHYEISLARRVCSSGVSWIRVATEDLYSGEPKLKHRLLRPAEARELARALLAAADLSDPDSEFEEAGK